ncbi:hypothetical protein AMJ83_11790 [candidate division WOR_3 bacterium SM23_42]|uniref:Outer membrane protein beta-barrel domain-containing protein n=1 Tax=candidate division WOR_3 bacterium SM23_42 TaxID=1703779 RepID=A0A0S8FMN8_UNCW3|nr:MAG: hypothetical protein AMJ83_11790 [candidate division WOR_3 bacterium SM23_42]
MADNINKDYTAYRYRKLEFPVFDRYYYTPGIRVKYEYGKPIDLRKQLTFTSSYIAIWCDDAVIHQADIQSRYGYGIMDFILIEGAVSIYYNHVVPQDTNSQSTIGVVPEVEFSYYIENGIDVGLDGGCDFRREQSQLPDDGYDYTANWFVEFHTRWRVF